MARLAATAAAVTLTALRMPVALALLLPGAAGLAWKGGLDRAWDRAALLSAPDLTLVPLVLMASNIAFHAGFATRVHDAAAVILQGRRGGLALAAVLGSAGFSTVAGSSAGCAATMARPAMPAMLGAGHDPQLAGPRSPWGARCCCPPPCRWREWLRQCCGGCDATRTQHPCRSRCGSRPARRCVRSGTRRSCSASLWADHQRPSDARDAVGRPA